jgi:hypothetical protein
MDSECIMLTLCRTAAAQAWGKEERSCATSTYQESGLVAGGLVVAGDDLLVEVAGEGRSDRARPLATSRDEAPRRAPLALHARRSRKQRPVLEEGQRGGALGQSQMEEGAPLPPCARSRAAPLTPGSRVMRRARPPPRAACRAAQGPAMPESLRSPEWV